MAILMSIKPKFSRQIFSGVKKYELRKTPIKNKSDNLVIVYESAPTKAIVGCFRINKILKRTPKEIWYAFKHEIGISEEEFFEYFKKKEWAYAIKVAHAKKFKNRITLEKIREINQSWRPPQSFYYLKENSEPNSLLKEEIEINRNLLSYI
ncbi:MAG: EVE domain-containing protein [Promethearchaeota archaeon]